MAVMITDPYLVVIWGSIIKERHRSKYRHFPEDYVRAAGICCEEAGEVMKEALDLTRVHQEGRLSLGGMTQEESAEAIESTRKRITDRMYEECMQLANVAIQAMENILKQEEGRT